MTADAKIGLLLGLVFIFIIAFIINGLPNLWGHPDSANAAPVVNKATEAPGLAGAAQDAQRKLDWQANVGTTPAPVTADAGTQAAAETSTQPLTVAKDESSVSPVLSQIPVAPSPLSVVTSPTLDAGIKSLTAALKPAETSNVAVQTPSELPIDTTGLAPEKTTTTAFAPAAASKETGKTTTTASVPAKTDKTTMSASTPVVATKAAANNKKPAPKEYVVQEGDTLGTIAKKVYGSVGGNVQRIYEFNRAVLKSEDVVTPGQKLRIPPLPATASSKPAKPEDVLPPSQFEKVAAMGKSNVTQPKVSTAAQVQTTASSGSGQTQADGRWYVVRENDNLWKIAAGQLGNGARFEEIVKLNGAILKDKDNLTPGTRLKLPAK